MGTVERLAYRPAAGDRPWRLESRPAARVCPRAEATGWFARPSQRDMGCRASSRVSLGAGPLRRRQRPLSHPAGGAGRLDRAGGCRALRPCGAAAARAHRAGPRARGAGAARRRRRRRRLAHRPGQRAGARGSHRPDRRFRTCGLGRRRRRPAALPPRSCEHRGPGPGGNTRARAPQRAKHGPGRPGLARVVAHGARLAQAAPGTGGARCLGLCTAGVVPADRRRRIHIWRPGAVSRA